MLRTHRLDHDAPLEHRYAGERPLRTLAYLYGRQPRKIALAVLCFALKHSPAWLIPAIIANVVDVVANPALHHRSELWINAAVLAVVLLQNIPFNYLYVRLLSDAARGVEVDLRSALCRRLQHLSISYYTRKSAAALQTKVLRDVEAVDQLTRLLFEVALVALFNIGFAFVIIGLRQAWFLGYMALTLPVQLWMLYAMHRKLRTSDMALRAEVESMSTRVVEMTHLLPVTRAHGLETAALERVGESLERVRAAGLKVDGINASFNAMSWVTGQGFYMACLFVPAFACLSGWLHIGAGDVVLLTTYFGLITNSLYNVIAAAPQIAKGMESVRSIGEVLQCPDLEQNEGKPALARVRGEIEFDNVTFVYPESTTPAVRDFSLLVSPGETVALVGPSGAGKSTLLNLAIGLLRPTSGHVLVDGNDLEDYDLRTYRSFLSVVPQESLLFHGTVRENVTYGVRSVSDRAIETALRDANAWDFVSELPGGLDTVIGERGAKLSGGQKQRLAIARALIRDPRVLILDEATSSLDTESEALIQQALARLRRGRTTFIVAHRLSTVRDAHRIVVLDHGRIVETGVHATLLDSGGLYARFQDQQAGSAR
jgi:ATP-binding cassette subfamily B protein